ncbi:MAG: class A beta-lactamase, partial [Verrucomicrobia bacterium]|nr:class A beta-lactamase [Verrucomicrobiota bacterium]
VRTFLWLAFLAVNGAALGENNAAARIAAIETRIGGRIGVAALDSSNGNRFDCRAEERFPMCSTFKFLAAAAVLKRVDEKKEKLDRFVPYGAKDILEYAPVTKAHLKDGGMTLGALCEAAVEQSDNTAGNLLLNAIGGPAGLTNFGRSLGDRVTRLDRTEPELNSAIPGDERDTTAPAVMCLDMQRLLLGDALSESSRHQLEEWLRRNETGGSMIRAGVPQGWIIGDKTGRGANGAMNDIAIMRPPDGAPILLAIYSVGSTATANDRAAAIAEIAKIIVESFSAPVPSAAKATPDYQSALHLFDYDSKAPLDVQDKAIEEFDGGTLHDITYTSPKGGPVAAYLVVPKSKGPSPAILFGHWGNGTRAEFIPEAKLYARAGAVSLIPDYPWDRSQPWRKAPNHYDKPEVDREIEIQAVVELRRGIDLLLARPDVDAQRLAYIGHSYGAQWGSILSAVDKRMKTAVLMAGVAETGDIFLRGSHPGIVELRKSQPPGQLERYAQVAGNIDAIHFVGHATPIPLLLQFGNFEEYFDKISMEHYAAAASDPKKVLYYDTGHDLNDPQALEDRYNWLVKHVGLRQVPIFPDSLPKVQTR